MYIRQFLQVIHQVYVTNWNKRQCSVTEILKLYVVKPVW